MRKASTSELPALIVFVKAPSPPRTMVESQVGGLVSEGPVCWLSEGKRVVVGLGNSLTAYIFDEEGAVKPTASFHGHESRVVAVVAVGDLRVASASSDGTVRVWGVEDGSQLRTIDFGEPLLDMIAVNDGRAVVCCASEVSLLTLQKDSQLTDEKVRVLKNLPKFSRRRVAASADASVIASIGDKFLSLACTSEGVTSVLEIKYRTSLTAVAVSNDGSMLALGSFEGMIMVYRDITGLKASKGDYKRIQRDDVPYSKLHWHSFNVLSLCFSELGNILYSGGCEGVLVVWKMTRTDFGQRNFKPRLSGAIWAISPSPNESKIALTHADNCVLFLHTLTLGVCAALRGIATAHLRSLAPWDVPRGCRAASKVLRLTPEPGDSGCVLVSGTSNSVQLYDVSHANHISDLQVVPRNTVFKGREDGASELNDDALSVRLLAVSSDKRFMVSVTRDRHPLTQSVEGEDRMYMETLKFWNYNLGSGKIELISRVDEPHGFVGEITAVAFHPSSPIFATASSSGTFKLWRPVVDEQHPDMPLWRCELSKNYRGLSCNSLSFALDGSMIAVGFENNITLWSIVDHAEGFTPSEAYDAGPNSDLISSRAPENSPFLLATTCNGVYVWDVVDRHVLWSSRMVIRSECTVVDTSSGRFAVVVKMPSNLSPSIQSRESSSGLSNTMNGSNAPARRKSGSVLKRQRSNDVNSSRDRLVLRNPKIATNGIEMDTAVIVYNCSSAAPVSISRLPSGSDVSGITFLPSPRPGAKSLICFDTNMEAIRVSPSQENDVWSNVTRSPESCLDVTGHSEDQTVLGDLLGNSWRTESARKHVCINSDADVSGSKPNPDLIPIHSVLDKYLSGPAGALPPASSYTLPLLRELVEATHTTVHDEETSPSCPVHIPERSEVPENQTNVPLVSGGAEETEDAGEMVSIASMSTFLQSLISRESK